MVLEAVLGSNPKRGDTLTLELNEQHPVLCAEFQRRKCQPAVVVVSVKPKVWESAGIDRRAHLFGKGDISISLRMGTFLFRVDTRHRPRLTTFAQWRIDPTAVAMYRTDFQLTRCICPGRLTSRRGEPPADSTFTP
jgi:hypothetical protein